jgi:ABC-type uncharacterized transport system permease subunit
MHNTMFTFPIIHNAVGIMTPFLLAGIGGLMTELAGMLNIALEGLILIGAFFSVVFAAATGSLFLGVLLGIGVSMLIAYIFGAITIYMQANVFITGLATNLLAGGLTTVLSFYLFGTKGVIRFQSLPDLAEFHVIVFLAYILIYRMPFGFHLRGTGMNPEALRSLGLKPTRFQLAGILMSGFTCGLAGAVLTLNLGAYVPNISAGRGWIALVVIYLGNKTPIGVLIASFVFGLAESFSNYAQGVTNVPADFILAFPYVVTVAAMVVFSIIQHKRNLLRG